MEKEIVHFSLEIYSNATWEVGEYGSFLDFNIKVYIHYSTAQTGGFHQSIVLLLFIKPVHQAPVVFITMLLPLPSPGNYFPCRISILTFLSQND